MKKLGICGNFGDENVTSSGQIIKTRILSDELIRRLGKDEVFIVNSKGGIREISRLLLQSFKMFKNCENIVMLPAQNGLCIFTPLYLFYNLFFHRKIEYVVIGGWLAGFIDERKWLCKMLKKFDAIFVETKTLKQSLEKRGLQNIILMPNCKKLNILESSQLIYQYEEPYKLCTFSRVMQEKGIEDAIEAVKSVNEYYGRNVFSLDIYGKVDSKQIEWFEDLSSKFTDEIRYCGNVLFSQSVEVIREYHALLFPTRFYTEGIPGTIIDAYASGVPVIASEWESFYDIVDSGYTGLGYSFKKKDELKEILIEISKEPEIIYRMKENCVKKAQEYIPENVVEVLINDIF